MAYSEALSQSRNNQEHNWLGRGDENRLEPEAWPRVTPRFRLTPGQRIFTLGSCFARNIEEYLSQLGFSIPTLKMSAPDESAGGRPNSILNKFTPAAIMQEIAWSRKILDRDGVVTWEDVEPLLFEVSPNRYLDLHLATTTPVSKDHALSLRTTLLEINKEGFDSDVVVITPGVIEAWLDTQTNLFVQRMPMPNIVKRAGADRFRFKVLTYEECHKSLSQAIDLLDPEGNKSFLLTVSPVPLSRTFTEQDILIANQYSKSLLRAVAGRICSERANCDYFPSYESVMLTKQSYVWQDDLLHISDGFISKIVRHLVSGRMDGHGEAADASLAFDALIHFGESLRQEDNTTALSLYKSLGEKVWEIKTPVFHANAAKFLRDTGDLDRALLHAKKLGELWPRKWRPLQLIATIQYRLGDLNSAIETAQEALTVAQEPKARHAIEQLISRMSKRGGK
jgi:tetratricopeptide (TPR) repeat protein